MENRWLMITVSMAFVIVITGMLSLYNIKMKELEVEEARVSFSLAQKYEEPKKKSFW